MPSCVIKQCPNHDKKVNKKKDGVSFFRLPVDPAMREVWRQVIRVQRAEPAFEGNSNHRVCSAHFDEHDYTITKSNRRILKPTAVPHLLISVSNKKKRKQKKQHYDPFEEYANDSTDEESYVNQDTSDEDNSNDEALSKSAYRKRQSEFGLTRFKRSRLDTSKELYCTEQLYEFGKFVAEQLMCLDEEDARIAQREIREVLSQYKMNKIMRCLSEPNTSKVHLVKDEYDAAVMTHTESQVTPAESTELEANSTEALIESSLQVNTAGTSTQSDRLLPSLTEVAEVNNDDDDPNMSSFPIGYVIVPAATSVGDDVNSVVTSVDQPGFTTVVGSVTQSGSSSENYFETLVKTEPVDIESHGHVNIMLPSVSVESLVIKFEPDEDGG